MKDDFDSIEEPFAETKVPAFRSLAEAMKEPSEEERLGPYCYSTHDGIVLDKYYHVAWDRCNTPDAILEWVYHLTGKGWMNTGLMKRFIRLAAEHHGIQVRKGV